MLRGARKPQAASRKPQAGSRKPEAASRKPDRKPQAASRKPGPQAASRKPQAEPQAASDLGALELLQQPRQLAHVGNLVERRPGECLCRHALVDPAHLVGHVDGMGAGFHHRQDVGSQRIADHHELPWLDAVPVRSGIGTVLTAGALIRGGQRWSGKVTYMLASEMADAGRSDGGWRHEIAFGLGWAVRRR